MKRGDRRPDFIRTRRIVAEFDKLPPRQREIAAGVLVQSFPQAFRRVKALLEQDPTPDHGAEPAA